MENRTRTAILGAVLTLGFIFPFIVGLVAERTVLGTRWMSAGPINRAAKPLDERMHSKHSEGSDSSNKGSRTDSLFPDWEMEPSGRQFRHAHDTAGNIHVDVRDKPANLVILDSQPESIEPELTHGRWLVLTYSVLSTDSLEAADNSPALARRLSGIARVAVRPTKAFEGMRKWLPGYERESQKGHPFWVIIEDGIAIRRYEGWMDNAEATQFAQP
jgi:hypothetical protein